MKKIAVLSDLHSGHVVGLTHPDWQETKQNKFQRVQRACWQFYADNIKQDGPFDIVFVNGDCIEGTGRATGGTELITVDREKQCEMATAALRLAIGRRTKSIFTYGTGYHTGDQEDWETLIAHDLNAEHIGSHEWVTVEGITFDLKHHCGTSAVPYGRHTAVARDRLWNVLWSERSMQPKSDVVIRSHVHYYDFCGSCDFLAMTTPALQGYGAKYGARRCSGIVHFGFVVFQVEKGEYSWQPRIALVDALRAKDIRL